MECQAPCIQMAWSIMRPTHERETLKLTFACGEGRYSVHQVADGQRCCRLTKILLSSMLRTTPLPIFEDVNSFYAGSTRLRLGTAWYFPECMCTALLLCEFLFCTRGALAASAADVVVVFFFLRLLQPLPPLANSCSCSAAVLTAIVPAVLKINSNREAYIRVACF